MESPDNSKLSGELSIILGPMYAGKTTEVVTRITTRADVMAKAGKTNETLLILHQDDTRMDVTSRVDDVSSHSSGFRGLSKLIDVVKVKELSKVDVDKYSTIGIDEGQFFPDLEENVRKWVLELNKDVIIASLDGDYKMNMFGDTLKLIPLCGPNLEKRSAMCLPHIKEFNKHVPAYYTAKTSGGSQQKEVGGSDLYMPVCMECHHKYSMH